MKNMLLIALSMMISGIAYSQKIQDKNVPEVVKANFNKQFPNAKEIKWEKENANIEAEFELNKIEQSVIFDEKGALLETEVEITISQLPMNVSTYIQKNYANQKIKEAAKITDSKGVVTFEAELKGMDLIFDSQGIFIKEINH